MQSAGTAFDICQHLHGLGLGDPSQVLAQDLREAQNAVERRHELVGEGASEEIGVAAQGAFLEAFGGLGASETDFDAGL